MQLGPSDCENNFNKFAAQLPRNTLNYRAVPLVGGSCERGMKALVGFLRQFGEYLEGCKGHTHKGHRENVPKVMTCRVFSGCFLGIVRVF